MYAKLHMSIREGPVAVMVEGWHTIYKLNQKLKNTKSLLKNEKT